MLSLKSNVFLVLSVSVEHSECLSSFVSSRICVDKPKLHHVMPEGRSSLVDAGSFQTFPDFTLKDEIGVVGRTIECEWTNLHTKLTIDDKTVVDYLTIVHFDLFAKRTTR